MTVVAAAAAVAAGALTVWHPAVPAAAAAALLLALVFGWALSSRAQAHIADKRFRWVSVAWGFLLADPIGNFTPGRSPLAATEGRPSLTNVVLVLIHVGIAFFAVASLRRNRLGGAVLWPVILLPTFALLSAAWSLAPPLTLALSVEMYAYVLLAMLTYGIMQADPNVGRAVVRRALRAAVLFVAALAVIGLRVGDAGTLGPLPPDVTNRFTWPGAHPLAAAAEVGFAFLIVAFGSRAETGFRPLSRAVLLGLFATCLYLGQTRTALIAVAVSALVGYLLTSSGRDVVRRVVGRVGVAATLFAASSLYGAAIYQYMLRGGTQAQLSGFDGRIGLWQLALQQVDSPWRWMWGHGLGGSRVLLASLTSWAAGAHSAWLELLLSLGFVGLVAGVAVVVAVGVQIAKSVRSHAPQTRLLAVVFVFVLTMSPALGVYGAPGPGPGLGFGVLALCYAVCRVRAPLTKAARTASRDLMPARPLETYAQPV